MVEISFEGIGTGWTILIDENIPRTKRVQLRLVTKSLVDQFDKQYSRFIKTSLVSQYFNSFNPKQLIPKEFANLLKFGLELKALTQGAFEPNISGILEAYGYDDTYHFQRDDRKLKAILPVDYHLDGDYLISSEPVLIDLGAWGKGFLIDQLADLLKKRNLKHFLVDGGGDLFGTSKQNGNSWSIALEHPKDLHQAVGMVNLNHRAIATSSPSRRVYQNFHHLIDARTKQPKRGVGAVYIQAASAMVADGLATAVFVSEPYFWDRLMQSFKAEYMVVFASGKFQKSHGFAAELF